MCPSTLPPAPVAAIRGGGETSPTLLNSERIEQRFGRCGIALLPSEAGLRRSSVYSRHAQERICRTYAVVQFSGQPEEWYREEHAKILAGHSIGATFRSHGWEVRKQSLYVGCLRLPEPHSEIAELMQLDRHSELAMHVYQLLLGREEQIFEYATIVETHHPAYLSVRDLRKLYECDKANTLSPDAVARLTALVLDTNQ